MRRAQSLAMPLAVATAAAFISIGQAADAQAATGGTLYVDNSATSHCSNSTTDSSVTPYCTIQAAVNATQPGDTVLAKSGDTFNTETPHHLLVPPVGAYARRPRRNDAARNRLRTRH